MNNWGLCKILTLYMLMETGIIFKGCFIDQVLTNWQGTFKIFLAFLNFILKKVFIKNTKTKKNLHSKIERSLILALHN